MIVTDTYFEFVEFINSLKNSESSKLLPQSMILKYFVKHSKIKYFNY